MTPNLTPQKSKDLEKRKVEELQKRLFERSVDRAAVHALRAHKFERNDGWGGKKQGKIGQTKCKILVKVLAGCQIIILVVTIVENL